MNKETKKEQNKGGFFKTGQIKVAQNPKEGIKKLAENEQEYGVDDLVQDSMSEEEEVDGDEECE